MNDVTATDLAKWLGVSRVGGSDGSAPERASTAFASATHKSSAWAEPFSRDPAELPLINRYFAVMVHALTRITRTK